MSLLCSRRLDFELLGTVVFVEEVLGGFLEVITEQSTKIKITETWTGLLKHVLFKRIKVAGLWIVYVNKSPRIGASHLTGSHRESSSDYRERPGILPTSHKPISFLNCSYLVKIIGRVKFREIKNIDSTSLDVLKETILEGLHLGLSQTIRLGHDRNYIDSTSKKLHELCITILQSKNMSIDQTKCNQILCTRDQ